jgi:hypothetical protein
MTDTDSDRTFLGLPVRGEIDSNTTNRKPQRSLDEFAPIVKAVLDDPDIDSFHWTQYTDYFNDGDPCIFHVHGFGLRFVDGHTNEILNSEAEEDEWQRLNFGYPYRYRDTIGYRPCRWEGNTYIYDSYVGPDEDRYNRVNDLYEALDGGEFLDVLLSAFGDHATVVITRRGIEVEFCEHD